MKKGDIVRITTQYLIDDIDEDYGFVLLRTTDNKFEMQDWPICASELELVEE